MILSKPYIIKELEGLAGNGLPDGAAVDRHACRRLRLRTTESRRASSASDGACKASPASSTDAAPNICSGVTAIRHADEPHEKRPTGIGVQILTVDDLARY